MDYSLLFSRRASGQTCSRFFCPGEVLEDAFFAFAHAFAWIMYSREVQQVAPVATLA